MLSRCERCHSVNTSEGQQLCGKCLARKEETVSLGLHPALEKKWGTKSVLPPKRSMFAEGQLSSVKKDYPHSTRVIERPISNPDITEAKLQASPIADPISLPRIPGFEISYQVGRGAMGSVYRARQVNSGRLVAIKVLSNELSLRSDLVARFERESYALKSLKHPNVVSIIDASHVEDTHYFAMEYIDGITLRTRINRGVITVSEACHITEMILRGLIAAHKLGIIHRDLKPENVLLTYEGHDFFKLPLRVVLVDFGLVGIGGLSFDPHPNLTRSRVTMGTVNYMAPEQHVDAKRVDNRSDLYSAGVILFEMITGELPLGRYFMPFERGITVKSQIDDILTRALARNLDQRYSNAETFLLDLENLREQEEKVKKSAGAEIEVGFWTNEFVSNFKRNAKLLFLVLLAAGFVGLGIGFYMAENSKNADKNAEAN